MCGVNPKAMVKTFVTEAERLKGESPQNLQTILQTVTLFNQVLRGHSRAQVNHCRQTLSLCQTLMSAKFQILSVLYQIIFEFCGSTHAQHLRDQCRTLFTGLLRHLPCSSREHCQKSCQKIIQHFVRKIGKSGSSEASSFLVSILSDSDDSGPALKPKEGVCRKPCRVVRSSGSKEWHEESLKNGLATQTKSEWKKWEGQNLLKGQDEGFMEVWQRLVSIRSNLGITSCRESIIHTQSLVRQVFQGEEKLESWKRKLDILNEVLCYGSTLALQGEMPDELSAIAQSIVREVIKAKGMSKTLPIRQPTAHPFLGQMSIETDEEENGKTSEISKLLVQNVSLLLLKSMAVTLREATSCSSGEESDSSHASRGCLDEEEVALIEKNMTFALNTWQKWIMEIKQEMAQEESPFVESFIDIFVDQDDALIEALLCLLDIHVALSVLSSSGNQSECHPITLFEHFMERCSWDTSIIIDFLLSNETCFLLYFLRFIKFYSKPISRSLASEKLNVFINEVHNSLSKLARNGLFPYDITPLMKLLSKICST